MSNKKPTQRDYIYAYMKDFGSITPFQAFADLGITKLSTRISEMKRLGYKIHTEFVNAKNSYGKPVQFAKHSLEEDKH